MKKLEYLYLSQTRVTESGLAKLADFERLSALTLNDLPISDTGIPSLLAMKGLDTIEMNRTKVTTAGFQRLADAGVNRINVNP